MTTEQRSHLFRSHKGQSMVEFVIVAPTILFLILGAIQIGLIYQAKATLNLATFHAARAGALHNADKDKIKKGLIEGLSPLYTFGTTWQDQIAGYQMAKGEVEGTQARAVVVGPASPSGSSGNLLDPWNPTGGHAPTQTVGPASIIEVLNPPVAAFGLNDHGIQATYAKHRFGSYVTHQVGALTQGNPWLEFAGKLITETISSTKEVRVIPNDNLMYRSSAKKPGSQINIQDANLLKIKVTFGYHLFIPFANTVIISLVRLADTSGQYSAFHDAQRLPLTSFATVRMQTDAIKELML